MKTLYFETQMGAAGDMLTASLVELFDDRNSIVDELNCLGLPNVTFSLEESIKCSIKGSHMSVKVYGVEEDEAMEHSHDHNHQHHHNTLSDIKAIVDSLRVSDKVKESVMKVYSIIAQAESFVHGASVEEVHFHEVGAMDAVADITAFCYLIEKLNPKRIISSPINTGNGYCRTMHGILPVPAPATAKILEGIPSYDDGTRGELCTPTGAALLKTFAQSFSQRPAMTIERVGFGMGKKDFERANCVRAFLGEDDNTFDDSVIELEANIDDMSAEDLAYAQEEILSSGALDVWSTCILMKKGRLGTKLSALVRECDEERVVKAIFKHTTTIGIRRSLKNRYTLNREEMIKEVEDNKIRVKYSSGYGVERSKLEFDDLKEIAKKSGKTLSEVRKFFN